MELFLPLLILLPMLGGVLLAVVKPQRAAIRNGIVAGFLTAHAGLSVFAVSAGLPGCRLFSLTDTLTLELQLDGVSAVFLLVAAFGFLAAGVYAFRYFLKEANDRGFFSFFLLALGALTGMDLAGNLFTMYLFFELVTLLSVPMVLHARTKEAIRAALKYLFYSMSGAFMALSCIFYLAHFSASQQFVPGGTLDPALVRGNETTLLIFAFLGIVGFSAKAGMYPLHGWLPSAHPVAPAPASAVLSGVVAKAGILAVIRLTFYSIGADLLRGTWVQHTLISLALLTVFMGSMMAYRETALKKRLAYSSVSQLSYILVGLFLMTPQSVAGGLLHVIFHAVIKICLFMIAGSFIKILGKYRVDELRGVGRAMPLTLGAFTLASLALIGIPPASGFVSKWYLALGALDAGLPVFNWLTPVILLISALLTAAYLLPITIGGFFPGEDAPLPERTDEGGALMLAPILTLGALSILLGIFSGRLCTALSELASLMTQG